MSEPKGPGAADAWAEHELSQLLYFRALPLRAKLEAVQNLADTVRHFERMRAEGKFRLAQESDS
jgi:hypothetical protein